MNVCLPNMLGVVIYGQLNSLALDSIIRKVIRWIKETEFGWFFTGIWAGSCCDLWFFCGGNILHGILELLPFLLKVLN